MPTKTVMNIDGKSTAVNVTSMNLSTSRPFNPEDGTVKGIQNVTAAFSILLGDETDSEAFVAAWFLDKSKKDVNIDVISTTDNNKFLSIGCLQAQVVSYNVNIDQSIAPPKENSEVQFMVSCQSITIGQSPLTIGF